LALDGAYWIGHRATDLDRNVTETSSARTVDPSRAPQPEPYMAFEQHPRYATARTLVARTAAADIQARE